MPRFYDKTQCRAKSDQHWEMAGLARQDGDRKEEARHTELARGWDTLANIGGGHHVMTKHDQRAWELYCKEAHDEGKIPEAGSWSSMSYQTQRIFLNKTEEQM